MVNGRGNVFILLGSRRSGYRRMRMLEDDLQWSFDATTMCNRARGQRIL